MTQTPSADEQIYQQINLKEKRSIDKFFSFQKGRGKLMPPSSYIGCSRNFRHCFKKIRDWRKLTKKQQKEEKEKERRFSLSEKKSFRSNIDFLMRTERKRGKETNESRVPLAPLANISNQQLNISPPPPSNKQRCYRMSNRRLVQSSLERAKEKNEEILNHVGIASSREERARRHEEMEEEIIDGNLFKKRRVGARPQFAYKAGDAVACKLLHQTMKQFAKYSDTATIKRGEDECAKPRNIALMMVLNDVEESSVNGGGAKEKGCAKRCKPEFLLLSDNKKDCKKIMSVFSEIFTTEEIFIGSSNMKMGQLQLQ